LGASASTAADEKVTFDDHVKPLFAQRCAACHNPNKKSGDLDVTNFTALMTGGGSGAVIEPGDATSSYLYALVTHEDSPEMPPDSDKIPAPEIELLQKWIDGGALENKASQAALPKKKKLAAVSVDSAKRPDIIPNPCRLTLEVDVAPHRSPVVTALATSPWAALTAVGSSKQVLLYDTNTQQLKGVLDFPEGQINVLRFSRSGTLLLAGGGRGAANGVVIAWDIRTGERVIELTGEIDAVLAADISNDHSLIALGGSQRVVRIFDTASGRMKHEIKKHTDWVQAIEFSPDGVLLATGDRSGGLLVWESGTAREYLDLRGHQAAITSVSWRIDSNALASASQDTTIKLWELENGNQIKSWGAHGGGVTSIEYTRDSRIASCGRDNHAKLFDQNGQQLKAYNMGELVSSVTHCDETNHLIACNFAGQLRIFNCNDDADLGFISAGPSKLALRQQTAQTQFVAIKTTFDALANAATQTQNAVITQQAELAALEKNAQELLAAYTQTTAEITQATADLESIKSQFSTAEDTVGKLTPGLANLGQAIEALDRAQSTMQSPQLEASRNQLTQLKSEHQTLLANNSALVKDLKPKVEALELKIGELTTTQTQSKTKLDQTNSLITTAKPELEKITAEATQKQAEFNAAKPEFDRLNAETQRLAQAVEFETQEAQLLSQLDAKWTAIESQADSIADASEAATELQNLMTEKQAAVSAKSVEITTWNQEVQKQLELQTQQDTKLAQLMSEIALHQKKKISLTESDVKLKESLTSIGAALELDPNDQAVKASLDGMTSLIESRSQLNLQLDGQLKEIDEMVTLSNQEVAQRKATQSELAGLITKAQDDVKNMSQEMEPFVAQQTAAEQKLAELNTQMQQLQSQHEGIRVALLTLRGVDIALIDPNAEADSLQILAATELAQEQ